MELDTEPYRIKPGERAGLSDRATNEDGGWDRDAGKKQVKKLGARMQDLQELLFASQSHGLLIVLQAMDTAGKDSTIRRVFGPLNAQGCRVRSFKKPTERELAQDYLWRVHQHAPAKGRIAIFNRSHYEDVMIVRVHDLVAESRWSKRFAHIDAFERLLADEGTVILKFWLHISRDYQRARLQRRLDRPDKWWKFNPADLEERKHWDAYQQAAEDAITRCTAEHAPWYVIPAERRWYRDLVISKIVVDALEGLDMQFPEPTFDPSAIEIE